jgi:hypothetical protein
MIRDLGRKAAFNEAAYFIAGTPNGVSFLTFSLSSSLSFLSSLSMLIPFRIHSSYSRLSAQAIARRFAALIR